MYYKEEKVKICKYCKKEFKTIDVRRKYCSMACSKKALRKKNIERQKRYEQRNKLKFKPINKDESVITLKCDYCGSKYTRYKSQVKYRGSKYCCKECKTFGQRNKTVSDKKLLDLWSEIVKLLAGNKCEYCGKGQYLNSHHIFSRSNLSTRYYFDNGVCLCAGHHVLSSKFSAHKTPVEFIEWLKNKRGEKWYEDLRKRAKSIKKYNRSEKIDLFYHCLDFRDHLRSGAIKRR